MAERPAPAKQVKTTVELPADLWRAAKIRAMDDQTDLRTVVIEALRRHLDVDDSPETTAA
ncbi:MAG: hypothetical protein FJW23_16950 [Acidimicrobiia bacterium]|nr:hypothetical protein [Acidimicrobiia bacterium]